MGKHSDKEKKIKQNRILNFILNHPGEYSKDELKLYFDVTTKTIENYIREFNEKGIKIKSSKKKCVLLGIEKDIETLEVDYGSEDMKKFTLLTVLIDYIGESKSVSMDEFIEDNKSDYWLEDNSEDGNYIKKLLWEMKKDNVINIYNKRISLIKNPLSSLDKNLLDKLVFYLNLIKDIHPKTSTYKNMYYKLNMLCNDFSKNIVSVKNFKNISCLDEDIVINLEKAIETNKFIQFKYANNINTIVALPTGIIYSHYKDVWYLVALRKGKRGLRIETSYKIDKILDLKLLEIEESSYFPRKKFETSLGMSQESPVEVKVQFEKDLFIKRKLLEYKKERISADLYESDDSIILTDCVNGINEFRAWVSAFGKSALCLQPDILREKVKEDIKTLKERYEL